MAPSDIYGSVMGETLMTSFSCHSSKRDYSFQVTSPINHTMCSFHSSRRDYSFQVTSPINHRCIHFILPGETICSGLILQEIGSIDLGWIPHREQYLSVLAYPLQVLTESNTIPFIVCRPLHVINLECRYNRTR